MTRLIAGARRGSPVLGQLSDGHVLASLHLIGLVSDTHGLIRPETLDALRGSELIIHCGDVGDPAVLEALGTLGPVRAVRGNNDKGAWTSLLPTHVVVEVGLHSMYVLHNLSELDLDPDAAGFTAVVSGHSHKPGIERRGKVLFENPSSAGPRRFSLLVTVATFALRPGSLRGENCRTRFISREPQPAIETGSRAASVILGTYAPDPAVLLSVPRVRIHQQTVRL